jgi:magnesium chelatase family protein
LDYQAKFSGPLFDRIDLHLDVPPVRATDLSLPPPAEGSFQIAARVAEARQIQRKRFADTADVRTNAETDGTLLEEIAAPDTDGGTLLTEAAERMRLSARGYHRVLRVARTIGDGGIRRLHIAKAHGTWPFTRRVSSRGPPVLS